MNYKFLSEFVGTYITCLIFILYTNNYTKFLNLVNTLVVMSVATAIAIIFLYEISYDFNPSFTLMFWFGEKRTNIELITFISAQLFAGWAAYQTTKLIIF
jgi:glycerol uptake facilitator-like aquaporin